jgi:hypothetical protein
MVRKGVTSVLLLTLATAVVGAAVALLPAAAAATTPAAVTFSAGETVVSASPKSPGLGPDAFYVTAEGTAVATGAVSGSFTEVDNTQLTNGPNLYAVQTLSDGSATITIDVAARFVSGTTTTESVLGDWSIVAGTGSYTDLHGSGTYAGTVCTACHPHAIEATLTGFAFYDGGS